MTKLRIWGLILLALLALAAGAWKWLRVGVPAASPAVIGSDAATPDPAVTNAAGAANTLPAARSEMLSSAAASRLSATAPPGIPPAVPGPGKHRDAAADHAMAAKAPTLAELTRRARSGDKQAARELGTALGECFGALTTVKPRALAELSAFGPDPYFTESQARRLAYLGPRADQCRAMFNDPSEEINAQNLIAALRAAQADAIAAGDFTARMWDAIASGTAWPPPVSVQANMRALALSHIDARNPQTLIDIAQFANLVSPMDHESAWHLAACDLGYDCAAHGALARRMCVLGGSCFNGSFEEYLLADLSPRRWEIVQAQRASLVRHLREGDHGSLFQNPPGGG